MIWNVISGSPSSASVCLWLFWCVFIIKYTYLHYGKKRENILGWCKNNFCTNLIPMFIIEWKERFYSCPLWKIKREFCICFLCKGKREFTSVHYAKERENFTSIHYGKEKENLHLFIIKWQKDKLHLFIMEWRKENLYLFIMKEMRECTSVYYGKVRGERKDNRHRYIIEWKEQISICSLWKGKTMYICSIWKGKRECIFVHYGMTKRKFTSVYYERNERIYICSLWK